MLTGNNVHKKGWRGYCILELMDDGFFSFAVVRQVQFVISPDELRLPHPASVARYELRFQVPGLIPC